MTMAIFRRNDAPQHLTRPDEVVPPAAPPMVPERHPLSRADLARLDRIRQGLAAFGEDTSTPDALGRLLDKTANEWVQVPTKRRPDPGAYINNFGVGLGDHLCEQLGGHWIMYTDDAGSELTVEIGEGGPLLFPIATVAQWWGTHFGWVAQYMTEAAAQVRTALAAPAAQQHVPQAAAAPAQPAPVTQAPAPASAQVNVLAKRALDRALALVQSGTGALAPFALVEDATGFVELTQFPGDPVTGLEQARSHVRISAGVRGGVAWDGALSQGGETFQAVLAEAGDRGESSLLVAQRHLAGQPVGPPMLVGRQAPIL